MNRLPARAGTWVALAVCAALLLWVVDGIAGMESRPGYMGHYYGYLVEGFLHGHTYLPVAPAPELAQLKDPYNPDQSAPYRLSDASLYHGKYYLYYGPTPAVVLMLPWRVLTGQEMPEREAAVVFAVLALAGLGALLLDVRARHFPRVSGWAAGTIVFVAMHGAWLPVLLRRPGFWELPHVAALACLWWTLYFLWRCSLGGGVGWAMGIGAGLALLVGCRPTYIFTAAALPLVALVPLGFGAGDRGSLAWRMPWKTAVAILVPLAAGGCALLLYNLLRFGRAGEFGQSYQLLNTAELHWPHFQPTVFFPFNVWIYLGSLPELSPYFPFFKTVLPGALPPGYVMSEEMHGALFAMPVHLAGWVAVAWAWRRRRSSDARALVVTIAGAAAVNLLSTCVLFSWAGASTRYLTELFGGWTVLTSIGLMAAFDPAASPAGGKGLLRLRIVLAVAAIWTVGYVWLASFEHGGLFRRTNPVAYGRMARVLDYPSLWEARREGVVFGPVELDVSLAPFTAQDSAVLMATGRLAMMNSLVLDRIDKDHVRLRLMENDTVLAEIRSIAVSGSHLDVRVEAPWLYPPSEHPFWDRYNDPIEKHDREARFAVTCSGQTGSGYSEYGFDATRLEPAVSGLGGGATAWVESMRRLSKAKS
jgi:hypothetical protein